MCAQSQRSLYKVIFPQSEESENMKTYLVDIHNGENGLIQESCFAEKEKKKKMEVSLSTLSFQIAS